MRRFMFGLVGVLAALAMSSQALAAQGVTVSALAGRAWDPAKTSCFFSGGGYSSGIQNTCTSATAWLIPLPVVASESPGISVSNVSASSVGSGAAPGCRYVARSMDDREVSMGSTRTVDGPNRTLGGGFTAYVGTSLHVDCWFAAATTRKLTQVSYTYYY